LEAKFHEDRNCRNVTMAFSDLTAETGGD